MERGRHGDRRSSKGFEAASVVRAANDAPLNNLGLVGLGSMLDAEVNDASSQPEWDAWVAAAPGGHHLQTSGGGTSKPAQGGRPLGSCCAAPESSWAAFNF